MRFWFTTGLLFIAFLPATTFSSDYKIEVFKENYIETPLSGGGESQIYHTIQAKTEFGNRLLILVGDDTTYRKYLRNLFKKNHLFIVKIPDDGDNTFQNDLAIPVNIQQIHPIWEKKWDCENCRHDTIEEENDIQPPGL